MKWALVMESSVHGFYVSEIMESEDKPNYHPTHLRGWRWIAVNQGEEVRVGDIWHGQSFHTPEVGQEKDHGSLK